MTKILVVDDEPNIIELTKLYFEREGYNVSVASTGREALDKMEIFYPDLVVLDIMLPDIDGLEVCRRIRLKSKVPILILSARREDVDKIVGLEIGADDYLSKPFNPHELVARVKAILRRTQLGAAPVQVLDIFGVHLDIPQREVNIAGRVTKLRSKEFDLLAVFASNPGVVLTRERLLSEVWGYDYYGETRTVDVHVNHLRDKLQGSGADIETYRGTGYKLVPRVGTT
ncbi:MAG: response regulator transcription factor [Dehalococcoidales bacterium]|nr:response regulator transcription factor [Dehalococcoidales bacterium]